MQLTDTIPHNLHFQNIYTANTLTWEIYQDNRDLLAKADHLMLHQKGYGRKQRT